MKELTKKLGLILLLISAALLLMNISLFAENQKLIKESSFKVKQSAEVVETFFVDASGADVKIETWNKDEVLVKILGNRKAEEKMSFEIERVDNGIRVTTKKKGISFFNFWDWINVKIEAYLPEKFNSDIETFGGDINIADLNGSQKLHTSGGDIKLENSSGDLNVETSGGDITIINHNSNSVLSTSGGDIQCKKISGNMKALTSGGNIDIESSNGIITAKTSGGDIRISYDGTFQGLYASTSGGDINLTFPSNTKASVELETTGGEIECYFSNSKSTKVTNSKFIADFNGGGEKLIAKTNGGDIYMTEK